MTSLIRCKKHCILFSSHPRLKNCIHRRRLRFRMVIFTGLRYNKIHCIRYCYVIIILTRYYNIDISHEIGERLIGQAPKRHHNIIMKVDRRVWDHSVFTYKVGISHRFGVGTRFQEIRFRVIYSLKKKNNNTNTANFRFWNRNYVFIKQW